MCFQFLSKNKLAESIVKMTTRVWLKNYLLATLYHFIIWQPYSLEYFPRNINFKFTIYSLNFFVKPALRVHLCHLVEVHELSWGQDHKRLSQVSQKAKQFS